MSDKPKWHIDPDLPPEIGSVSPETDVEKASFSHSAPKAPPPWKRVQWTTYIRPDLLQTLKAMAEDRSNESRRRITPADLLDEALGAYLKKYRS
jgi:hypothetical protein